jgi:hypothetical protein
MKLSPSVVEPAPKECALFNEGLSILNGVGALAAL